MDQYPFLVSFYVSGIDVENLISILKTNGFTEQSKTVELQFLKQLKNINNEN